MTTELGLLSALSPLVGPLGKPLVTGKTGSLFMGGTIGSGLVLPLLLRIGLNLTRKTTSRSFNIVASLLVLVGGMILRYIRIEAGRISADDPQAVHYYNSLEWKERKNRR